MTTMPPFPNPHNDVRQQLSGERAARLEELLCDRAVFGLDPADEAELATLVGEAVDWPSDEDLAAAEASLGGLDEATLNETLPPDLRQRLLSEAQQFDFAEAAAQVSPLTTGPQAVAASVAAPVVTEAPSRVRGVVWLLATAASLLIGLGLGGQLFRDSVEPTPPALAQQLESLRGLAGVTTVAWTATEDPAAVGPGGEREGYDWGEVVWSDAEQRGFMVFHGLAANDPSAEQYQLWMFDEQRTDDYPVDGGVFDIQGEPGEPVANAIVPILAKLPVTKAKMFAVTVEKPGGVVVSDRSRLPLLAQL